MMIGVLLALSFIVAIGAGADRSPTAHRPEPFVLWVVAFALLAALGTIPLAFRRRWPVVVLALVVGASAAMTFLGQTPIQVLAMWIGLYSVAAHTERRTAVRAGLAALAVLALPLYLSGDIGPVEATFELGFLALGWMFGAYLGELRGRAARVRREHENETKRAIAEEQARIARELHDVMAHSVSVMVVQAAAAEDVFDATPERAREALRSIESTGRRALAEVRRVLDAIRPEDGEGGPLSPQPTLARLDDLLGQVRATGVPVTLRIVGSRSDLPDGVDLSAYRIVQEALTNTLKHGRGVSAVSVVLRYDPAEFLVEVCDDGTATAATDGATGRGLIGMRERVALYGGDLVAGPRSGGGFGVVARFPIESEPEAR